MVTLIEAVIALLGEFFPKILRIFGFAVADIATSALLDDLERGGSAARRARRRLGRHVKRARRAGDVEALILLWEQPRNEHYRSVRIDALCAIVDIDAALAEPLLREALQRPEDPWVVLAALDRISHHRMVGLSDAVAQAMEDPRRAIAQMAGHTASRLACG